LIFLMPLVLGTWVFYPSLTPENCRRAHSCDLWTFPPCHRLVLLLLALPPAGEKPNSPEVVINWWSCPPSRLQHKHNLRPNRSLGLGDGDQHKYESNQIIRKGVTSANYCYTKSRFRVGMAHCVVPQRLQAPKSCDAPPLQICSLWPPKKKN